MQRRAPNFGFPIVLARDRSVGLSRGSADLVQIRYGTVDAAGLAGLDDPKVIHSLELDRLFVPASRLLGEEDLYAGWSVSTEHQERSEFLKGGSCQLAALLALASSSLKRNMVRPGLLGAGLIWATGCVTPKAELAPVRDDDFPIKLRAFLESDDAIFMAPESDWKELAAGEGASLRHAFRSLSLPEFRAAVDLPDRDWRGSEERPQKWAVRLPEGPLAPVLETVFSTAGRWEAPSQIDKSLAATVRFNHASNGLRLRPDNVERLNAFLQATRELGDWLFAVDELCALVQGAGTDIAAARALSYASAVSKTQPVFAEPLWNLVVSLGGEFDVAERALLDIFRTEGRRDERIALLRSRAASDRVSPTARVAASEECAELLVAAEPFAAIEVWLRLLVVDPSNARALAGVHEVVRSAPATVSVLMDPSRTPVLLAVIDALSDAEAANLVDIVIDHGSPRDEDQSLLRHLAGQALTRFFDLDLALRAFARSCQPETVDAAGVRWVAPLLASEGDVDRFARVFSAAGLQSMGLSVLTAVGADLRKTAALRFRALAQALTFTSDRTQAEETDRSLLSLTASLGPRQAGIELIPSHPDYSPAVRCALFERSLVGVRGRRRFSLLFDFGNFLLQRGLWVEALDRYREAVGLMSHCPLELRFGVAKCADELYSMHRRSGAIDAAALWSLGAALIAVSSEFSGPLDKFHGIFLDSDDWLAVVLMIEERSRSDSDARTGCELLLSLSRLFLRGGEPELALDLWCRAWRLERGLPSARDTLQQVLKRQRSHPMTRTRWHGATMPHTVGFHDGIATIDLAAYAEDRPPARRVDDAPLTERFPLDDAAWNKLVASVRDLDDQLMGKAATADGAALRTNLLRAAKDAGQWAECVSVLCHLEALHGGGEYLYRAAEVVLTRLGQPRRALELFRRSSVHRTVVGAAPFTLSCAQEDDDLDDALRAIGEIRHHFSMWGRGPADAALLMSLADLQWDCSRNANECARYWMVLIVQGSDDRPLEALVHLARETSDLSWVAKSLGSMPSRAAARIVARVRQYVDDLGAQKDGPVLADIVLVAELLLTCDDANAAFDRLAPEASRFFKSWRFRVQLRSSAYRAGRLAEVVSIYQRTLETCSDEAFRRILSEEVNRCRRRSM